MLPLVPPRLACKQTGAHEAALEALKHLHGAAPAHAETMVLVAGCHEQAGATADAIEWMVSKDHRILGIHVNVFCAFLMLKLWPENHQARTERIALIRHASLEEQPLSSQ